MKELFSQVRRLEASRLQIDRAWQRLEERPPRRLLWPIFALAAALVVVSLWPRPPAVPMETLKASEPVEQVRRVPPMVVRKPKVRRSAVAISDYAMKPPVESALGEVALEIVPSEAELLARSLHELRQAHDPAAALRALDEARSLQGVLTEEIRLVRVEALFALHRRGDALVELDEAPSLRPELRLTRAELRAELGHTEAALADFRELDGERALWGRAVCRARFGDREGGKSELKELLRRFPDGAHAEEARKALSP